MTALHLPASLQLPASQGSCIRLSRFALGLIAMAWAVGAQAFVTVGPSGTFPTIQGGINQAIANGGDEVRVQLQCFVGCSYSENVNFSSSASIVLSGGWASDFQSQISGLNSAITGTGANAPLMQAFVSGSAITTISRFNLDGSGVVATNSASSNTHGLVVGAQDSASVLVYNNTISGNDVYTFNASLIPGGAGVALQATNTAVIFMNNNIIQSNRLFGSDAHATYGAGAFVTTIGSGHVDFVANTITSNFTNNTAGGACRGGGIWAASLDTSSMQLLGNTYTGNAQFACANGATGDAAEIDASNTAVIQVRDETWTSNAIPNDPGVYEVYMQADVSSHISAQNGLITHGTWGGLLANSIASGSIDISNYTIADNPVLGFHGFGIGTELWNTVLWNNGNNTPVLETGSTVGFSLFGTDPHFVNAASGNYRLLYGSPAINFGTNTPTGGLRLVDLDGAIRPYQGVADAGAYEWRPDPGDLIFANGFD
ncbi:MAG: choice-of-anchor Q domain-containing protein [Dokdonella sp.]